MTRSSGGHTHHRSIPQGANRWVRGALVSAIPSHVRTAPQRVAAARQLLRIVYIMLRRGEAWRSKPVSSADVRDEVHA